MQRLSRVLRAVDSFIDWVGKIVGPLIMVITLIMMFEIIMRYAFNKPTLWAHETVTMLFGGFLMLGGGYCMRYRSHVNMDIVLLKLPMRNRKILEVIGYSLFYIFCIVLLWQGGTMAIKSLMLNEHTTSVWGPPWYPVKLTIPAGAFLILLQGTANFTRDLVFAITGREVE